MAGGGTGFFESLPGAQRQTDESGQVNGGTGFFESLPGHLGQNLETYTTPNIKIFLEHYNDNDPIFGKIRLEVGKIFSYINTFPNGTNKNNLLQKLEEIIYYLLGIIASDAAIDTGKIMSALNSLWKYSQSTIVTYGELYAQLDSLSGELKASFEDLNENGSIETEAGESYYSEEGIKLRDGRLATSNQNLLDGVKEIKSEKPISFDSMLHWIQNDFLSTYGLKFRAGTSVSKWIELRINELKSCYRNNPPSCFISEEGFQNLFNMDGLSENDKQLKLMGIKRLYNMITRQNGLLIHLSDNRNTNNGKIDFGPIFSIIDGIADDVYSQKGPTFKVDLIKLAGSASGETLGDLEFPTKAEALEYLTGLKRDIANMEPGMLQDIIASIPGGEYLAVGWEYGQHIVASAVVLFYARLLYRGAVGIGSFHVRMRGRIERIAQGMSSVDFQAQYSNSVNELISRFSAAGIKDEKMKRLIEFRENLKRTSDQKGVARTSNYARVIFMLDAEAAHKGFLASSLRGDFWGFSLDSALGKDPEPPKTTNFRGILSYPAAIRAGYTSRLTDGTFSWSPIEMASSLEENKAGIDNLVKFIDDTNNLFEDYVKNNPAITDKNKVLKELGLKWESFLGWGGQAVLDPSDFEKFARSLPPDLHKIFTGQGDAFFRLIRAEKTIIPQTQEEKTLKSLKYSPMVPDRFQSGLVATFHLAKYAPTEEEYEKIMNTYLNEKGIETTIKALAAENHDPRYMLTEAEVKNMFPRTSVVTGDATIDSRIPQVINYLNATKDSKTGFVMYNIGRILQGEHPIDYMDPILCERLSAKFPTLAAAMKADSITFWKEFTIISGVQPKHLYIEAEFGKLKLHSELDDLISILRKTGIVNIKMTDIDTIKSTIDLGATSSTGIHYRYTNLQQILNHSVEINGVSKKLGEHLADNKSIILKLIQDSAKAKGLRALGKTLSAEFERLILDASSSGSRVGNDVKILKNLRRIATLLL